MRYAAAAPIAHAQLSSAVLAVRHRQADRQRERGQGRREGGTDGRRREERGSEGGRERGKEAGRGKEGGREGGRVFVDAASIREIYEHEGEEGEPDA